MSLCGENKGLSRLRSPSEGLTSQECVPTFESSVLFSQRHRMKEEKWELEYLGDNDVIRCGETHRLGDARDRLTRTRKSGEFLSLSTLWPDVDPVPL